MILQSFFNAIEERLLSKGKKVTLVALQNIMPCKFNAYKTINQVVWAIGEGTKLPIAEIEFTDRMVEEEEKARMKEKVDYQTMLKVLEYYGI